MELVYLKYLFIYLTLGYSHARKGRLPVIKEHPTSIVTRRNEPVTLNCAASSDAEIQWFKDGFPILSGSEDPRRGHVNLFGGSLYFMRVSAKNDAGTYWCTATNKFGTVRSENATVMVASLSDKYLQHPAPVVKVKLGEPFLLSCSPPKGSPPPVVLWKHDGRALVNTSRLSVTKTGDLSVKNAVDSDSGVYVCIAQNPAGTRESKSAEVTVLESPWFEIIPRNVSAGVGTVVEFQCKAKGNPLPKITWRRLDGKIHLPKLEEVKGINILRIEEVNTDHSGVYVCEARNEVGFANSFVSLNVVTAPEAKVKPSDIYSIVGKNVEIKCEVDGEPKPFILWKLPHDNQNVLMKNQTNIHASVSKNGFSLKVKDVNLEDSGRYHCWAVSSGGGISLSSKLVVVQKFPPPVIGIRPVDHLNVPLGNKVRFSCEYTIETSDATVTWWFQEEGHLPPRELTYKDLVTFSPSTGTLIIEHVRKSDEGIYTCNVTSKSGSVEAEALLSVSDKFMLPETDGDSLKRIPFPPTKPEIDFFNTSSVHLSWLPNSQLTNSSEKTDYYTVEYWRYPWQEWRVALPEVQKTSVLVDSLSSDTAYVFLVRAVNGYGESFPSPWSETVYTTTGSNSFFLNDHQNLQWKLGRPVVTLQTARANSPYEVILTWEYSRTVEVDVDGILIYTIGGDQLETATVFGRSANTHLVRNLLPNSQYTFFLVPFLKSFEGVPSNSLKVITPEEAPDVAPSGLMVEVYEAGTTLLKWKPLNPVEARGNIVGYRVSITLDNITTMHFTQNSWLKVQDLVGGRLYTVRVAGVSGGGDGPYSPPVPLGSTYSDSGANQNKSYEDNVPAIFYAPPHPGWLLYLLVPLFILIIIIALIFFRKVRYKSTPSTLDSNAMGSALYSPPSVYSPSQQVNVYGEQKIWRSSCDQESSFSSAQLLHQDRLANEYAEPKIQIKQFTDHTEPYATTALLSPSSPCIVHTPPSWRNVRRKDIQINWTTLIPPPPTYPPPISFPPHHHDSGESYNSRTSSDRSSERRRCNTGSSTPYHNAEAVSEEYEKPYDLTNCDLEFEPPYAVYSETTGTPVQERSFQTFSSLSSRPAQLVEKDLSQPRIVPLKNNTH